MANFDIFVSPGVFTKEIDITFVPAGAASIVGTVIGMTMKGPAYIPVRVQGYSDFVARFGPTNPNLYAPYAVKSYLRNASSVYVIRILGTDNVTLGKAAQIAFPSSGIADNSTVASSAASTNTVFAILRQRPNSKTTFLSYTGNYSSVTISAEGKAVVVSFDPNQETYIRKVLGTDSTTAYLGDALTGVYVDAVFDYASATGSITGSGTAQLISTNAFEPTYYKSIAGGYTTAGTPIIVSQNYSGSVYNLFKFYTLSDGDASNYDIKVSILNVETLDSNGNPIEFPKFDVVVRGFTDTDRKSVVYETFARVTLDPTDKNFIARVIGDRYYTADLTQNPPEVIERGEFDNKSKYIRVEVYDGYPASARPSGFKGIPKGQSPKLIPAIPYKTNHLDANNDLSENVFMGVDFSEDGIISRLKPTVTQIAETNSPYTSSSDSGFLLISTPFEIGSSANLSSSYTITNISVTSGNWNQGVIQFTVPTYGGFNGYSQEYPEKTLQCNGSLTAGYINAAKIISNTREFDTNLVVTPGVNSSTPGNVVGRMLEVIEGRNDCFYIIDVAATSDVDSGLDTSIASAIEEAAKYDSSYAATYYPWLKIQDVDNDKYVWVPPSVEVFGAYAYNDRVAQPWSAVAGFTRAGLSNVKSVRKRITQSQSNTLYNGKINPIVSFANEGIVIFGQKTLQTKTSALDRVNVRRLLLEVRKMIASFAKYSVFEPNDAQTRQSLVAIIRPYLARVQELRGLYDFRIQIDNTTTTPDLIDRNILYGKIFLKPTRTAEFIALDFILTQTGANFDEM
jgi:hypothetical protein